MGPAPSRINPNVRARHPTGDRPAAHPKSNQSRVITADEKLTGLLSLNVGSFDYEWTDEHQWLPFWDFLDANPYGVLVVPGHVYVVDAGANTLDAVTPDDFLFWEGEKGDKM